MLVYVKVQATVLDVRFYEHMERQWKNSRTIQPSPKIVYMVQHAESDRAGEQWPGDRGPDISHILGAIHAHKIYVLYQYLPSFCVMNTKPLRCLEDEACYCSDGFERSEKSSFSTFD